MKAFITGSRAYGKASKESDIDLVVLVDPGTAMLLTHASDSGNVPVRFGKLNLILCDSETEFAAWKAGTDAMVLKHREEARPIDKEEAKKSFDVIRKAVGISDNFDSGD